MKHLTVLCALILPLLATMAGCNTVKGMGQDIQKAGSVIEDVAKKK
jgi:entericidin A